MTGAAGPDSAAGPPRVLAVGGSDPAGVAGLQADLKTLLALGVHGMSVVTAVTAQNSVAVTGVWELPAQAVQAQLAAVLDDVRVDAVKTGMLFSAPIVEAVAASLAGTGAPLVVDPVMASTTGRALIEPEAVEALVAHLLPRATVVTPNLAELRHLTGVTVAGLPGLRRAAEATLALGPRWVLAKGGHLPPGEDAVDVLTDGTTTVELRSPRLATRHTRGTGCTLAAAVAAHLARGLPVPEAVRAAKDYVTGAIAGGYAIGAGPGPVDHGWQFRAPDLNP